MTEWQKPNYHRGMSWQPYFDKNKNRPPNPLLAKALAAFSQWNRDSTNRLAIDLGSGAGIESAMLVNLGWDVYAIDREDKAESAILERISKSLARTHFHFMCSQFEMLPALPKANLFYAYHSIPFCERQQVSALWKSIGRSISRNGIFAAGLFGQDDDWVKSGKAIGYSADEAMSLLPGFEGLERQESREGGLHLVEVIARKLDE